jgi:hypothetical protein
MHRNPQFTNTQDMGRGPWLLRRPAWLAFSLLLGLLGLAMHLTQAAATAAPGQGPAVVIQSPVADESTAVPGLQSTCGSAPSHAECGEAESSDGADQGMITAPRSTLAAVQSLPPVWAQGPAGLAAVQPLLRPPRRQG